MRGDANPIVNIFDYQISGFFMTRNPDFSNRISMTDRIIKKVVKHFFKQKICKYFVCTCRELNSNHIRGVQCGKNYTDILPCGLFHTNSLVIPRKFNLFLNFQNDDVQFMYKH